LSEAPTLGSRYNKNDLPIYLGHTASDIPFNITKVSDYNIDNLYLKYHAAPKEPSNELIFIIRNPKEVLLRHLNYKIVMDGWDGYESYFNSIEFYNNFNGKKILFYYEDIVTNKVEFIKSLALFLGNIKDEKKDYVIKNIDYLYKSAKNVGHKWGGINSNSIDYYYKRISDINFKKEFDSYIESKMNDTKYIIIKNKYFRSPEACLSSQCKFLRHSNKSNNGGTHCCYACKIDNGHGPMCQRLMQPQTRA